MRARLATHQDLRVTPAIEKYIAAAQKSEAWQVRQLAETLRTKAGKGESMSGLSVLDMRLLASHCDQIATRKEIGK